MEPQNTPIDLIITQDHINQGIKNMKGNDYICKNCIVAVATNEQFGVEGSLVTNSYVYIGNKINRKYYLCEKGRQLIRLSNQESTRYLINPQTIKLIPTGAQNESNT